MNKTECNPLEFDGFTILNLILLFVLEVGLGAQLEFNDFKSQFKKPKGLIVASFSQFIGMPLIGYLIAITLLQDQHQAYSVGLLAVVCSPGGAVSNILCLLFQADLTLSVAMTTCSSLLSMALMPLNLYIYLVLTGLSDGLCIDMLGIALGKIYLYMMIYNNNNI